MDGTDPVNAAAVFCVVNGNADTPATHGSCFGAICPIPAATTLNSAIHCTRSSWAPAVAAFITTADASADPAFTSAMVASTTLPAGI